MFDPESRFVVLGSPPVAYAVFRFDTEETLGDKDAEVVYWYVTLAHVVQMGSYAAADQID